MFWIGDRDDSQNSFPGIDYMIITCFDACRYVTKLWRMFSEDNFVLPLKFGPNFAYVK